MTDLLGGTLLHNHYINDLLITDLGSYAVYSWDERAVCYIHYTVFICLRVLWV